MTSTVVIVLCCLPIAVVHVPPVPQLLEFVVLMSLVTLQCQLIKHGLATLSCFDFKQTALSVQYIFIQNKWQNFLDHMPYSLKMPKMKLSYFMLEQPHLIFHQDYFFQVIQHDAGLVSSGKWAHNTSHFYL